MYRSCHLVIAKSFLLELIILKVKSHPDGAKSLFNFEISNKVAWAH